MPRRSRHPGPLARRRGAGRAFSGEPGAPVTGVGGAGGAVGNPLSAATAPLPDEDTEMPAPGEIWLEALSSAAPLRAVPPSSISLSSATTSFELP